MEPFKRFVLVCFLMVWTIVTLASAQGDPPVIPKNTKLRVRINQYMDNSTVKTSYPFNGLLAEPLIVKGKTIFPEGSYVEGHVDDVRPKRHEDADSPKGTIRTNLELEPSDLDLVIKMVRNGNTYATLIVYPTRVKDTRDPASEGSLGRTVAGTAIDDVIIATTGGRVSKTNDPNHGPKNDPPEEPPNSRRRATVDPQTVLVFKLAVDAEVREGTPPAQDVKPNDSKNENENVTTDDKTQNLGPWDRFSKEKKTSILDCFSKNADSIPTGYGKRDTSASSPDVKRGDVLGMDAFSRSKIMPPVCRAVLHGLPESRNVVVLNAYALLLDSDNRVLDVIDLLSQ